MNIDYIFIEKYLYQYNELELTSENEQKRQDHIEAGYLHDYNRKITMSIIETCKNYSSYVIQQDLLIPYGQLLMFARSMKLTPIDILSLIGICTTYIFERNNFIKICTKYGLQEMIKSTTKSLLEKKMIRKIQNQYEPTIVYPEPIKLQMIYLQMWMEKMILIITGMEKALPGNGAYQLKDNHHFKQFK